MIDVHARLDDRRSGTPRGPRAAVVGVVLVPMEALVGREIEDERAVEDDRGGRRDRAARSGSRVDVTRRPVATMHRDAAVLERAPRADASSGCTSSRPTTGCRRDR